MSQLVAKSLIFQAAIIKPTEEMHDVKVIVYNPCDGWHLGNIRADRDGEDVYIGIYDGHFHELTPHSFYVAWAVLPDGIKLGEKFEDQEGYRWDFENCSGT